MSKFPSISEILSGKVAVGEEVSVRGWVRTRRDSKAGLSFLAVYDGSCFDPIQAIINNDLPNYQDEVLRLTAGCSVIVTGKIVESPAEGQAVELQATNVEVVGWVEDPDTYPMAAKTPLYRILTRSSTPSPTHKLNRCSGTCSSLLSTSNSPFLPRTRLLLGGYPVNYCL